MTDAERAAAAKDIASAPRVVRPILQRAMDDPIAFRAGLYALLPRVIFVLVPLLAVVIGWFYRGRHYPEHLYFAIHLASYVFLVLTVAELAKFTYMTLISAIVGIAAQCSIPIYAFRALRRVYGGSAGQTLAREIGIGVAYLVAYCAALLGVLYYAAVTA